MRVFARVATTEPSKRTAGKQAGMTERQLTTENWKLSTNRYPLNAIITGILDPWNPWTLLLYLTNLTLITILNRM